MMTDIFYSDDAPKRRDFGVASLLTDAELDAIEASKDDEDDTGPEIYRVGGTFDYMQFVIDEKSGLFMAHGSHGTFAYRWWSRGDETLKQFLAGLDYHYFMKKTTPCHGLQFDFDRSVDAIKQTICERRKWGELSKEQARLAWDAVDDLEDGSDENYFRTQVYQHNDLYPLFIDGYVPTCRMKNGVCNDFWEKLWPQFLAEIGTNPGTIAPMAR